MKFKFVILLGVLILTTSCANNKWGAFDSLQNVGKVSLPGAVLYDANSNTYRITGSGENIWGTEDAFAFLNKQVAGDVTMSVSVDFEGEGKHEHRKAGCMVRESMAAGSRYVDAVLHGDGLVSMQFRRETDGETFEVKAPVTHVKNLMLERHADVFTFSLLTADGGIEPVGSIVLPMSEQVYAGLAVTSHDSTVSETALLSNVTFENAGVFADSERVLESTLEVINMETRQRRIIRRVLEHFEAPNWSRDGKYFVYNKEGRLYKLPVTGGEPEEISTGFATTCNNDHGFSPDGSQIAISHNTKEQGSIIYLVPANGGEPKQITPVGPSYWHGWSPDGKTLAYCAQRNGEFDVYSVPVTGGKETRLTTAKGLDDGPDYSPDGKYIYFNSVRTGLMKIWRMRTNGSRQEQMTFGDEYGDWFAHPSPDGKDLVFVSFDKSVEGHPMNKPVVLRTMSANGGEPEIIAYLFGGQGTINVPSWSPDSKEVAFVSYRLVGKK